MSRHKDFLINQQVSWNVIQVLIVSHLFPPNGQDHQPTRGLLGDNDGSHPLSRRASFPKGVALGKCP